MVHSQHNMSWHVIASAALRMKEVSYKLLNLNQHSFASVFSSVNQVQAIKMVKHLPFAEITVPSPGFGAMGISHGLCNNLTLEQAEPVLLKALELGCTFWDTAVSVSSRQVDL